MNLRTLDAIADGLDAEAPFWAYLFPPPVRELITLGPRLWPQAMKAAIRGGVRGPDKLANLAFFMQHPSRLGREIDPSERDAAQLMKEWKKFRREAKTMLRRSPIGTPKPLAFVNTPLPRAAAGLHAAKSQRLQYGLPETIDTLLAIGKAWLARHPKGPKVQISDIGRRGGGPFPPHGSHRMGIDVDIRFMRTDAKMQAVNPLIPGQKRFFDKALTQELVDVINANGLQTPHKIWVNRKIGLTGVDGDGSHNNHMHVRFCMPTKYKLRAARKATGLLGVGTYITCK